MNPRAVYFTMAAGVFGVELAIAAGVVAGPFVRGSVGDILAVALIYFALRAFPSVPPVRAASIAVGVGFVLEGLQWLRVADLLGLEAGHVLHTLVGNTFSLADLGMYLVGGAAALVVDRLVLIPRLRPASQDALSRG